MKTLQRFRLRKNISIYIVLVAFSSLALGFDTAPHFDLTRTVLQERGFGDTAIKVTQLENWLTDYYSSTPTTSKANRADLEKLHFDNLYTTGEIKNYWGWLTNNLKTSAQKAARENDRVAMLTVIGIGLHATQDFYSHSNWVETHPSLNNGVYQVETYFSNPSAASDLFTGKYPSDRTTGFTGTPVPGNAQNHGDYKVGVNKDSPIRPRWQEAYIFAYYASHELIGAFEQWSEEARPGFWNSIQQFQSPTENKELDYDLRAIRNISMWVDSKGANGHWKGDRSGYDPYFAAFSAKWVASKTSSFVKQMSEGSLPNQLSQNLYTNVAPPPMPSIAPFSANKRAVLVSTTLIKEINVSGCAPGLVQDGALCYPQCKAGYTGVGPVCWESCAPGFKDIGAFCQKSASYTRGAGYVAWQQKKCEDENKQGCEKKGLIWYPKCKPGFVAGVTECYQNCPIGQADTGTGCTKNSYGRGTGNALRTAEIDPLGKPDFYSVITIGGQPYTDRVLQNLEELDNPWTSIHLLDESASEVPINFAVFDEDNTDASGSVKDDLVDINPIPGKLNLDFKLRLRDNSLFGDINGRYETPFNSFMASGATPDKNGAIVKAFVTHFLLRRKP